MQIQWILKYSVWLCVILNPRSQASDQNLEMIHLHHCIEDLSGCWTLISQDYHHSWSDDTMWRGHTCWRGRNCYQASWLPWKVHKKWQVVPWQMASKYWGTARASISSVDMVGRVFFIRFADFLLFKEYVQGICSRKEVSIRYLYICWLEVFRALIALWSILVHIPCSCHNHQFASQFFRGFVNDPAVNNY